MHGSSRANELVVMFGGGESVVCFGNRVVPSVIWALTWVFSRVIAACRTATKKICNPKIWILLPPPLRVLSLGSSWEVLWVSQKRLSMSARKRRG